MSQHISCGFTAEDLFQYLSKMDAETRGKIPVFLRVADRCKPLNVKTLDFIEDSTYSFFGKAVPCLILNDSRFAPEEE